jgi:serine/threonine protein kinase
LQELQERDPRRIGPYRLVGRLGAGGMGRVYVGRSSAGRLVAVKVIREELAADPEFLARFTREVAAAKSVSGMYTACVVDADTTGLEPWLATAYVAGPSLAQAVRDCGPLPLASARALAAGLAEGLAAIHAAGLVHRDLKPSNVLLAEDGPRVIDFGISQASEGTSLTHTGLVLGSPGFMSPEQATGDEVGPPSDVFSLGAVVAFAAAGQAPFGDGNTAALVYRVVHALPALEGVPEELRSLAERCLAKDPAQRPTTAELLAELDGTDLSGGWLPAPIVAELAQHIPPALLSDSGGLDQVPPDAPAGPVDGPATVTVRKPSPPTPPAAPRPVPVAPADVPPSRRIGRRLGVLVSCAALLLVAGAIGALALNGGARGQTPLAETGASGAAVAAVTSSPGASSGSGSTGTSRAGASPGGASPTAKAPRVSTGQPPGVHGSSGPGHPSPSLTLSTNSPGGPVGSNPPVTKPIANAPATTVPGAPQNVTTTANSGYEVTVHWADSSPGTTGFNVDNGCPVGACGGPDAELHTTTGPVNSTTFPAQPGTWICFRVQAISGAGDSAWSGYGCVQTPGLTVSGATEWTSSGLTLNAGDRIGITAAGTVHIDPAYPVGPGGTATCTPAKNYPTSTTPFPGPSAPCWSLVARIGNGAAFEVGTSAQFIATAGVLYLGVNDNNFADNSGSWTVNIKKGGGLPPAA